MLIAATFNRGKYMYKSREGGCATAEQKHRTEREREPKGFALLLPFRPVFW